MKAYRIIIFSLLVLLTTGCMTVSTSGEYTLSGDRTLRGDLIITSGEATLEEGSHVTGNVFMTSGILNVDGHVDGDIIYSSAESINLGPKSVVDGDIKGTSGNVYRDEGSQVGGMIGNDQAFTLGAGFFSKVFGVLCGIPLALLGSIVYLLSNRRRKMIETTSNSVNSGTGDIPAKLKQLKQMQEESLISLEDYEAKKTDVLRAL